MIEAPKIAGKELEFLEWDQSRLCHLPGNCLHPQVRMCQPLCPPSLLVKWAQLVSMLRKIHDSGYWQCHLCEVRLHRKVTQRHPCATCALQSSLSLMQLGNTSESTIAIFIVYDFWALFFCSINANIIASSGGPCTSADCSGIAVPPDILLGAQYQTISCSGAFYADVIDWTIMPSDHQRADQCHKATGEWTELTMGLQSPYDMTKYALVQCVSLHLWPLQSAYQIIGGHHWRSGFSKGLIWSSSHIWRILVQLICILPYRRW